LLVALTLAAIVLATATGSLLRQQRTASALSASVAGESQAQAATLALSSGLAGLAPASGDLAQGEARDSSLQLRAVILTGFACADASGQVAVGGASVEDSTSASLSPAHVGDSLWWYAGAPAVWKARLVTHVASSAHCANTGAHSAELLSIGGSDTIPRAAPIRVTRQTRYVVYRGGDGTWQLGVREWSDAAARFASVEPVAGPFLRRTASGSRTGFRYFDAGGLELPPDAGIDVARVARIRVTVLRANFAVAAGRVQSDSVDVAVQGALAP
jgi:hypothetical protein